MPAASSLNVLPTAIDPRPQSRHADARLISDKESQLIADLMREFSQMTIWRNTTAHHCEEIAELILPTSRNTFFYGNWNWPGMKKTQQQIDATADLALHRFCAICDSLVTPRDYFWHGLTSNDYVMADPATRAWFEQVRKILFKLRYAANANFSAQNYNNWQSLGAFGNATMYVDMFDHTRFGGLPGFRYKALPFGETFYGENHQGRVDRMYRWFRRTAYQAVQQWGREWLPPNLVSPLEQDSLWPYNFLHVVKPREDFDPRRLDIRGMPFASYYVSMEGRCLMAPEGGYRVFPFAVSRYDQTPMEVYGRGPAHIVLPAMKTLNAQKVTFLKQGHRASDPVLLISDDGLMDINTRPGAQNRGGVTPDGKALVHTLPTGDIKINIEMMHEERSIIDDVFLVSLFKVLTEHPDMTATQVVELVNEKGMLVAPTLGRQFSEYVGGLVDREADLAVHAGFLPKMPPRLAEAKGEYEVTNESPLARAAKMSEAAGFNRWVENLQRISVETQDPSWMDPINGDQAAVDLADIYSVRPSWVANDDQITQKRKARAQQAEQQQEIAAAPGKAAIMNAQAKMAGVGPPQLGGPAAGPAGGP